MTAILRTGDVVTVSPLYPNLIRDLLSGLFRWLGRWAK